MIKITYQTAKSINAEPLNTIQKIDNKLLDLGYEIVSKDNDSIAFKNKFWQVGSRTAGWTKVDGGRFKVTSLENKMELVLSYYVSFDIVIYFAVFLTLSSLVFSEYHILYLMLGVLIVHLLRIDNIKSLGKKMIDTILM